MKRRLLSAPDFWIVFIFIAGIVYLLALQLLVSDGVYFSGDAGLKALLTENLASGNLGFDIKLADPSWVKTLWGQGLFPYQAPYVYDITGKYFITFRYAFSLVTAPFYALWGYRGLYVIPWLSTVGTWLIFSLFCKKLGLKPVSIAIGSFILVFASNLSTYSAIYWEHTTAVFLSFTGLYLLFPKKESPFVSAKSVFWAGVLTSLAVWFRDEQILLVVFLGLLSLGSWIKRIRPGFLKIPGLGKMADSLGKAGWVYPLVCLLTLCLYGVTNELIYHNFLGLHTLEVVNQQPLLERLQTFLGNLRLMTVGYYSLFLYVPITLFPFIYMIISWRKPDRLKNSSDWNIWGLFSLFFLLGVALLVPAGAGGKQWGPRLILFLVPLLLLLFTWQLDHLLRVPIKDYGNAGRIGSGLVAIAVLVGIIQNPLRGSLFLNQSYSQASPTIAELRAEDEPVVAVSDQFLAQVFQPVVSPDIIFLLVPHTQELALFSQTLVAQNLHSFSYMCFSYDCKLFKPDQKSAQVDQNGWFTICKSSNPASTAFLQFTISGSLLSRFFERLSLLGSRFSISYFPHPNSLNGVLCKLWSTGENHQTLSPDACKNTG